MKLRRLALALTALLVVTAQPALAANTSVTYKLYHFEGGNWVRYMQADPFPGGGNLPGTNSWKYTYTVKNTGFAGSGINTWYAFFNSDNILCATLSSAAAPPNWTTLQQGPIIPNNNWKERFRTTVPASNITLNNSLAGYEVVFTWTCNGLPGNQNYDAVTSGGSETSTTTEDPEAPVATVDKTWGAVKSIYR